MRRLGYGAMGEVWEAENVDTDRAVALKLITSPDPETRRRLLREARAIGRLEHPNIVQILDRGESDAGEPFLVMQLLRGETLAARLTRERKLPEPVAAGIALDVARALRVAHEKQIVHRDLKPANIFLHTELDAEAEVVKVVDFGVSKLSIENEGGSTQAGGLIGSPAYMSPEQIRATGVDGRTDVWAVGVLLYEMIAGERPFNASNSVAVLTQILMKVAPRVESVASGVSPAMSDVIAACLERDPSRRVASAEELIKLLRPLAPRSRLATMQDAAALERFTAIQEAPKPPPSNAPAAEDLDSEVATAVFKPSAVLQEMIARVPPPGPATGTVPMSSRGVSTPVPVPTPAPRAPVRPRSVRDTAPTAVYRAGAKRPEEPPPVDDELSTAEIVPKAQALPPPPAPPPPAMSEPRAPLSSAPTSQPPSSSAPFSQPHVPAPPPASFDFGSGSWQAVVDVSAATPMPSSADAEVRAAFGGTQPLTPEMLAAVRGPTVASSDPRKTTLKMDMSLAPPSPMAAANPPRSEPAPVTMGPQAAPNPWPAEPAAASPMPSSVPPHADLGSSAMHPSPIISATAPLNAPAPEVILMPDLPVRPPSKRSLPLVLLAISALALAIVLTMLVITLAGGDGSSPAQTSATGSAGTPASASAPTGK